jgi:hypothetical protein
MKTNPTAMLRNLLLGAIFPLLCAVAMLGQAHAASLSLSWQDNSTDESGFTIERSLDGTVFDQVGTVTAGVTTYTDADLPDLTGYYYRVRAFRNGDYSPYSNTAEGQTSDSLPPVIDEAIAFGSPTLAVVTFSEPIDASTGGNAANYELDAGFSVASASVAGNTVTLAVTPLMTPGSYTLTVNNITDVSGNALAQDTTQTLTYLATDPTLVCWYPFNLLATDESGNGNDGTVVGATLATGKQGQAYLLTSGSDHIQMPLGTLTAAAGTFTVWVYPNAFPAAPQSILGHTSSTSAWADRLQLYTEDIDGNLALGIGDNHAVASAIVQLAVQQWQHVALTWDGNVYRLYIDGVEAATGSYSGLTQLGAFADVGNSGSADARTSGFDGIVDEVRLYSRALDAAEIAALITVPRPKAPTDLRVVE